MPVSPPPTPARERLIDAFETLLNEQGERAGTLDAVARAAGVSKGGLLYHFGSKDALVDALIARLDARSAEDVERIRSAPEGVVAYVLRTSFAADSPFDRTILAVSRVAQGSDARARDALARLHDSLLGAVSEAVPDPALARAIVLISDGLYYNSALLPSTRAGGSASAEVSDSPAAQERRGRVDDLLGLVDRMLAASAADRD